MRWGGGKHAHTLSSRYRVSRTFHPPAPHTFARHREALTTNTRRTASNTTMGKSGAGHRHTCARVQTA
eukprot:3475035-Prymnesium_polylepis.2